MGKRRKTTKAQFARFKKAFEHYVDLLGMTDWMISIFHKELEEGTTAEIEVRNAERAATVRMATEIDAATWADFDPELNAKHEAIHLLIAGLDYLATRRYVNADEIYRENERIVVTLEKVIP